MNLDKIAISRIEKLLKLAEEICFEDKALSIRYVELARKIAMRHRLSLGSKRFCKKCNTIFIAGKTLKVRVSPIKKSVLYACLICSAVKKFPYSKEKSQAKKGKAR